MIKGTVVWGILLLALAIGITARSWQIQQAMVDRLMVINIFLLLFFLYLTVSDIYFAANPAKNQTPVYMGIYFFVCVLFLFYLMFVYKDYVNHSMTNDVVKMMANMMK